MAVSSTMGTPPRYQWRDRRDRITREKKITKNNSKHVSKRKNSSNSSNSGDCDTNSANDADVDEDSDDGGKQQRKQVQ